MLPFTGKELKASIDKDPHFRRCINAIIIFPCQNVQKSHVNLKRIILFPFILIRLNHLIVAGFSVWDYQTVEPMMKGVNG